MDTFEWFRLWLDGIVILAFFEENSRVNVRSVHVVTTVKARRSSSMLAMTAGDILLPFAKFYASAI